MSKKSKRNIWMTDEGHDRLLGHCDTSKKTKGDFIEFLMDLYEKGELMRTEIEKEQISTLRMMKKMLSDLTTNQEIELNVLNTMCEINDYNNFVSIEEQESFAFSEARKHVKEQNHKRIIRQLEEQKSNG